MATCISTAAVWGGRATATLPGRRSGAGTVPINGRLRDELLNETLFASLGQARSVLADWRQEYNRTRPHSALGNLVPAALAATSRLAQEAA